MKSKIRKGIILAGGSGTRLYPLTAGITKQLLPVYDKPMIYYPLSTLMSLDMRDILIISTPSDLPQLATLLGDGSRIGINLCYAVQAEPHGIPQAFEIGADFIGGENVALILGDNIFGGLDQIEAGLAGFDCGGMIFGHRVSNPSRYGVVEVDSAGKPISIEEKPDHPKSDFAVTGLYFYDPRVVQMTRSLKPSARGELEISDLNRVWLDEGELRLVRFDDRQVWFDVGTPESMLRAARYVASFADDGVLLGSIEITALRQGFIDRGQLQCLVDGMPTCRYKEQLVSVGINADS